jgi:cytochrome c6
MHHYKCIITIERGEDLPFSPLSIVSQLFLQRNLSRKSQKISRTHQGGYRPIDIEKIQEMAWYSIAKEIAHGENQVGILLRSGQFFLTRLQTNFYSTMNHLASVSSRVGRFCVAIVLTISISLTIPPAQAAPLPTPPLAPVEPTLGAKVFTANCAACHIGGNNVILAEKNLSKDALSKYAMDSIAAIKMQVTGGKNAMPAFGENLTSAEIEAVARYVLTQSQQDWKGSTVGLQ